MVKWEIKEQDEQVVRQLCEQLQTDEVTARLLCNRGLTDQTQVQRFFDIDLAYLHDPLALNDMDKAVARILSAIQAREKITIYGDYDVDGITSVVVLLKYLRSCGADVAYYIPDRAGEGYGLNIPALQSILDSGTGLVITVDTGTTAIEEIAWAVANGLDVVVTDHHECKDELPDCVAVVNPKRNDGMYPFKELAGVGVVFKLVCALSGDTQQSFARYGDLVAVGTIADIMPLVDENRMIVSLGLQQMQQHASVPMRALLEASGGYRNGKIGAGSIAYQIAPRLNAAGRIGDPSVSVALMMSEDIQSARELSEELCQENRERQQMEFDILKDVRQMLSGKKSEDKIIVVASDQWHHGVIGIVASRIVEHYHKPCILICFDGQHAKGSARSIRGVSMFDLLCQVSDLLEKFGGHEMAAGLTLQRDRYEEFVERITQVANETITDEMLIPVVEAECELKKKDLSLQTVYRISKLEPFGAGNPTPYFCVRNLTITDIFSVGMGKHLKLCVQWDGTEFTAMYFGMRLQDFDYAVGDRVSIICCMSENVFNHQSSLSLSIKSIMPSDEIVQQNSFYQKMYKTYIQTGTVTDEMQLTRREMVYVYKYLIRQMHAQQTHFQPFALARSIRRAVKGFHYCKLMLALRVFEELGILSVQTDHGIEIVFRDTQSKVNLSLSPTWQDIGINREQKDDQNG